MIREAEFHRRRAEILYSQKRHALAADEFHKAVALAPEDGAARARLALCLAHLDRRRESLDELQRAIGADPGDPRVHATASLVHGHLEQYGRAIAAAETALRLDPDDPYIYAVAAQARCHGQQWAAALDLAERGLALDGLNAQCANIRGLALARLGRRDEAVGVIDTVLAQDPEDAFTHANMGWNLVASQQNDRAAAHFRESLRLDPTDDWARDGLKRSLKSRNLLYRGIMLYFLWMARFPPKARTGLIFGAWLLMQILGRIARAHPAAEPFITPVAIVYGVFCILTWVADPIFNGLLALDRRDRGILSPRERMESLAMVVLCALFLLTFVAFIVTGLRIVFAAWISVLLLIPLTRFAFRTKHHWRRVLWISLIALIVVFWLSVGYVLWRAALSQPVHFK